MANKKVEKRPRRPFDDSFKREQVRRFLEERKKTKITLKAFARKLDVVPNLLRGWVERYGPEFGFAGFTGRPPSEKAVAEARALEQQESAPATSDLPSARLPPLSAVMAPSGDWVEDEGAQLKLAMGVTEPSEDADGHQETAPSDESRTLLSRPEPEPESQPRQRRRREGPGIVRRPVPEVYGHVEPEAQVASGGAGNPDFMAKVTAETMADNAALMRVMKLMIRDADQRR